MLALMLDRGARAADDLGNAVLAGVIEAMLEELVDHMRDPGSDDQRRRYVAMLVERGIEG